MALARRVSCRRALPRASRGGVAPRALLGGGPGGPKKGGAGLALVPAAVNLPHPEKVQKGGEDAWFIRVDGAGGSLGVADGVGGSAEGGVDPGLYAKVLMLEAAEKDKELAKKDSFDPVAVIEHAHGNTRLPGASTAVVMQLDGAAAVLNAANLGDSGFRVVRDGQVAFASPALQHFFDCPYQLSYDVYNDVTDSAEDAEVFEVPVEAGDVIIAGSDGVFDNVFDEELLDMTAKALEQAGGDELEAARTVAKEVAALARAHAADQKFESPYALESAKEAGGGKGGGLKMPGPLGSIFGSKPAGGKMDDITVVAAVVADATAAKAALDGANTEAAARGEWEKKLRAQAAEVQKKAELREEVERASKAAIQKAVEKEQAVKANAPPLFSAADIENMDKAELQRVLSANGMPTSGKLASLKERVASLKK